MSKPTYEELEKRIKEFEKAEAERRETVKSNRFTQYSLDNVGDAAYWFDSDAHFKYVNNAACRALGYSREELLTMTVHDVDPNFPKSVWPSHWEELRKRRTFTFETRHLTKDRRIFPVEVTVNYVKSDNNEYNCAIAKDITERRKAEESLKETEERFRTFVEQSPVAIEIYEPTGRLLIVNDAWTKFWGLKKEAVADFNILDDPECEKTGLTSAFREAQQGRTLILPETLYDAEESGLTGGRKRWISSKMYPVTDPEKKVKNIVLTYEDITERKRAEEAVKLSEAKKNALISNISDVIATLDEQCIIQYKSPNIEQHLGWLPEDLIGKNCFETVHVDDRERIQGELTELLQYKDMVKTIEYRFRCKDESYCPVQLSAINLLHDPLVNGILLNYHDITERILAEEALKESEAKFRGLVETTSDFIWELDYKGVYTYVSPQVEAILGYKQKELINKSPLDLLPPEEKERIGVIFRDVTSKGRSITSLEKTALHKDGRRIVLETSGVPFYGNDGNISGYRGINRDITERKKAEEELRESEFFLQESQRVSKLGSYVYDIVNDSMSWTNTLDNIFGVRDTNKKDIKRWISTVFEEDRQIMSDYFIKEVIGKGKNFDREYRIINQETGNIVWVHGLGGLKYDKNNNPIKMIGTIQDITDRKKSEEEKKNLEEQLFHSQKMESIGRLAGGIAHDFNNILTGIMGYSELMKLQFPDENTNAGNAAEIIYEGSVRAAELTKQLLGFARRGKYNPVPLNINEVIKGSIKVSEKIFEKKIQVVLDLNEDIYSIEADKNQIDQVLTNLIINAKDAMPNGGKLTFKTEHVSLDENFIKSFPEFLSGEYVKISITDTGVGIHKDIKGSVFDPFFTTKGEGKGTGLGLATVYGIIKNHHGHINVYSESGEGATFTLYFPVSGKEIVKAKKQIVVKTGDATILVADDEKNVRTYCEEILKKLGYKVLLASNGKEAVRIYNEKKDEIDLVLLDMIMPEMAGKETNSKLREINPDVKVILASGYSQNGKATEILNEGASGFIQKPFRMDELSKAIAEALK